MAPYSKVVPFKDPSGNRRVSKTTLYIGNHIAEIYTSLRDQPVYHYVITTRGSAEIICWGQELSMQEAEDSATAYLRSLAIRSTSGG